tara:strand:- start:379 stop:570 length:192 start_codon:yes stop_codon:yes gene_type:complete
VEKVTHPIPTFSKKLLKVTEQTFRKKFLEVNALDLWWKSSTTKVQQKVAEPIPSLGKMSLRKD